MKLQKIDTKPGTTLKRVDMNIKFGLHHRVKKDGSRLIYLIINPGRIRFPTGISVDKNLWDQQKQIVKGKTQNAYNINIKLQSILQKIHHITTRYYVMNQFLDAEILMKEYHQEVIDIDFIIYIENKLKQIKNSVSIQTYNGYESIYKKLKEWRKSILFTELDLNLIKSYCNWCRNERNNNNITINSNLAVIKRFLSLAQEDNIITKLKMSDIRTRTTRGNVIPLTPEETMLIYKNWKKGNYKENEKFAVSIFLIACFMGLRIADIMAFQKKNINNNEYFLVVAKTQKQIRVPVTTKAREILNTIELPNQFDESNLRKRLKDFCERIGFERKFSFHTGRHTFGTNFIISGGSIEVLRQILGHSNIQTTMIYLQIAKNYARKEIDQMDDFMNQFL